MAVVKRSKFAAQSERFAPEQRSLLEEIRRHRLQSIAVAVTTKSFVHLEPEILRRVFRRRQDTRDRYR